MTMDAMNAYLEKRGFKVTRKYKPELACYEFIVTKDDFYLQRNFKYPTTNPVERDRIQKYFLEAITEEFERAFEKENKMYNNVKLDVKAVTIERDPTRCIPTIKVDIKPNTVNLPDATDLAVYIHNKLNDKDRLTPEEQYIINDYTVTKQLMNSVYGYGAGAFRSSKPTLKIKKVIFNNPATIIYWMDDTKTVVKCQNGEPFDPEKGLAMAITKRVLGDKGNYFDTIKKYTKDVPVEEKKDITFESTSAALERGMLKDNQKEVLSILRRVLYNTKATKAEMADAMEQAIIRLGCGLDE